MSNVNKEYSDTTLGTQEPQVTVVGYEFVPGAEGNAMISQARGYHVCRFPNGESYHSTHPDPSDTNPLPAGYLLCKTPDYCGDSAMTCELLEILGVALMVFKTEKPKGAKKFEPGFSAFFEIDNTLYATVSMPTEDDACACALWSVLANKSRLT